MKRESINVLKTGKRTLRPSLALVLALSLVFFGANYAPWAYQTLGMLVFAYVVRFHGLDSGSDPEHHTPPGLAAGLAPPVSDASSQTAYTDAAASNSPAPRLDSGTNSHLDTGSLDPAGHSSVPATG
jgi:hypothetical protein